MTAIGEVTHIDTLALLDGPRWARCSEPERPTDLHVVYLWDCRWCMLGMQADVLYDPLGYSAVRDPDGEILSASRTLLEALVQAMQWRKSKGLTMEEPTWEPS